MTIDEYLNRCRDLRKRAERLRNKYYDLQAAATSPGISFNSDGATRAKDPHGRENLLATMIDAGQDMKLAELDYIEYRQYLFNQLIKLPNRDESEALIMRYVEERAIEDICKAWTASRRNVFRYLRSGKDNLREKLQNSGLEIE